LHENNFLINGKILELSPADDVYGLNICFMYFDVTGASLRKAIATQKYHINLHGTVGVHSVIQGRRGVEKKRPLGIG
jgi:hypothetical protein